MNPDTLVVVHCYEGDAYRVNAFLPWFLHHQCPVLVLSPADSQVRIQHPEVKSRSGGKAGWKGQHTLARQVKHWELALKEKANWFLLNDADSMCITDELPAYLYSDENKFWCNVLCHENEHLESDKPNLNPPYFMSRKILKQLVKASKDFEIPEEANLEPHDWGQAIDGFYSHLVMNVCKIPYENMPDGATTWPRGVGDLVNQARWRGARLFHGVKDMSHMSLVTMEFNFWLTEQTRLAALAEGQTGFFEGDTIRV